MRNGVNAVFTHIKNILLQCDTVSNKKINTTKSPKEAGAMVGSEDGVSNQDSIWGNSENKTDVTRLTGFNVESSLVADIGLNDINAKRSAQTDVIDISSLNMSRTATQVLMEDDNIQLIFEMSNTIEETRKEVREMKEEMKGMIEHIRKENKRMDENIRDLYKKVKTGNEMRK